MTKLTLVVCAVLAVTSCVTHVRAEESALPKKMIGFLKPGMRVGIQSVEGTTNVKLDVYTEEHYQLARDLAALGKKPLAAAEFANNRPVVQKELDDFIERLVKKSPDVDIKQVVVFPLFRISFGTISVVGDDYIAIDREGARKKRLILARSAVSQIDLDAEALRLFHRLMR